MHKCMRVGSTDQPAARTTCSTSSNTNSPVEAPLVVLRKLPTCRQMHAQAQWTLRHAGTPGQAECVSTSASENQPGLLSNKAQYLAALFVRQDRASVLSGALALLEQGISKGPSTREHQECFKQCPTDCNVSSHNDRYVVVMERGQQALFPSTTAP
eukprot:1161540-Pelagomonas_calceolata.AAC.5